MSCSIHRRPHLPSITESWSSSSGVSSTDDSDFGDVDTPLTERSFYLDGDNNYGEERPARNDYVLVVGGCGYIGSHTVWELIKAECNVIVVDNLSNSFSSVIDTLRNMTLHHYQTQPSRAPLLEFYEVDYRDKDKMEAILRKYAAKAQCFQAKSRITGVIHFAAYKAVSESISFPLKYYSNNVGGLIDFCGLLGEYGIKKLVFSSSATVYGTIADQGFPLQERHCSHKRDVCADDDGQNISIEPGSSGLTNPYGRSKWMCEAILTDLSIADPEWCISCLRYFNPIGCDESGLLGEDPRAAASNLMPVVLRVLTGMAPLLKIYGDDFDTPDGTAVRDFIHVTDLALGHLAALNSERESGCETYNLGCGRGYSVLEFVSVMEEVAQRKIPTQLVGRREGDVGSCVAQARKAELDLGWKADRNLDLCCRDTWRFLERVLVVPKESVVSEEIEESIVPVDTKACLQPATEEVVRV